MQEIKTLIENNHVVSATSAIATRQDISREELSVFDASVRSWLCSADEAMLSNQKKLMLILNNISVPISSGSSTYPTVLDAWTQAMNRFESLLGGASQEVYNGAVLRALSSWHLYPSLTVLVEKTVNVHFEDSLIPEGTVITIGLQSTDPKQNEGIKWSLTLSHLRYYGDPVSVETTGGSALVNILQLHLVAFGSLLGNWHILEKDTVATATWFRTLWNVLGKPSNRTNPVHRDRFPWLDTLVIAAESYLESSGSDLETVKSLVSYGRRERGHSFLSNRSDHPIPFFGLGNLAILASLEADSEVECGIKYFRELARQIALRRIVLISVDVQLERGWKYAEFATAVPHIESSLK